MYKHLCQPSLIISQRRVAEKPGHGRRQLTLRSALIWPRTGLTSVRDITRSVSRVGRIYQTLGESCLPVLSTSARTTTHFRVIRTTELPSRLWRRFDKSPQDNDDDVEYVALSHCWGDGSFKKLTHANYRDLREEFSLEELPLTWQDAIRVSRNLGFLYIWIDALCIIQKHDEDDIWSDWGFESALMIEIYGNCRLNLAALGGESSASGLFTRRNPLLYATCNLAEHLGNGLLSPEYTVISAEVSASDAFPDNCNIQQLLHASPWWKYTTAMTQEPLNRRGWVLQERALSSRTVYFGNAGLFWDCRVTEHGEFPDSEPQATRELANIKKALLRAQDGAKESSGQAPDGWYSLVDMYRQASLTFESDRLVAISGIAKILWKMMGAGYNVGLWDNTIVEDLLWCVPKPLPKPVQQPPSRKSDAPSFSWVSLHQPTSLHWPFRKHATAYKELNEAVSSHKYRTTFHPIHDDGLELVVLNINAIDKATVHFETTDPSSILPSRPPIASPCNPALYAFFDREDGRSSATHLISLARVSVDGGCLVDFGLLVVLNVRGMRAEQGDAQRIGMYVEVREKEADFLAQKHPEYGSINVRLT